MGVIFGTISNSGSLLLAISEITNESKVNACVLLWTLRQCEIIVFLLRQLMTHILYISETY